MPHLGTDLGQFALSVQLPRSGIIVLALAIRRVRAGMTHGSTRTSGSSTVTSYSISFPVLVNLSTTRI